jgi:cell division protease FtsH
LLDRLDAYLGGRVAEEIVFGDVSTGAENDLDRATALVRHMVTRCGMSAALGLATFDGSSPDPGYFPPVGRGEHYSESTAKLVDDEVRRVLAAAHERVRRTLGDRRAQLDRIAKRLLECEVLDQQTLLRLIAGDDAPAPGTQHLASDAAIASNG